MPVNAAFNTHASVATYRSTHMTHQAGMTRWTESERTEQCAQVCTGKERPRQNDARKNGTCQTRPCAGSPWVPSKHAQNHSQHDEWWCSHVMAMVRVMLVRVCKNQGFKAPSVPSARCVDARRERCRRRCRCSRA